MLLSSQLGQTGRLNVVKPALKPVPTRPWPLLVPKRAAPQLLQGPRQIHLRRVAQGAATQPEPASAPPAPDGSINLKKGFWTFVDVVAILGSVGGALAAILNLFSGTYVLFLPLVLPVISLLSALQREGLIAEDNRRAYDTLRVSLTRDSTALLADARGALEEVRRELRGQNTTAARLGTIEARLSSLEGSILSAGRSAREAAAGLGVLPERLGAEQRAVLEGLVAAMRVELRRAAESLANNETTALARLDARLAAVEGSLSGLEVAQSEGLRRLSMSLNSALADAEATLQSSVRNEVARSMEPVRRLPQMLAVALPPALAAAEAVEASAAGLVGGPAAAGGGAGGPPPPAAVSPEQLQAIVAQEVEGAVARILDFQADAFGRLAAVRPVPMDDEQWSALGRRLSRLERLVEGVPAGTEGVLLQGGQLTAAVAAAAAEALAPALAEARAAAAAAAASEAEGVRNDILAAQTVVRESVEGLGAALAPLQLGISELAAAVAAVTEAQQRQGRTLAAALEAAATARGEGEEVTGAAAAAPPPPALPPADLTRLLEGLETVTSLLRDVDTKMDGVASAVAQLPAAASAAPAAVPPPVAAEPAAEEAAAAAASAAAATARQQQQELQAGIEAMREALTALTTQVGLIASRPTAPPAPAADAAEAAPRPSAPAGGVIADVLSFEASLTAAAPPPERGPSTGAGAGTTADGDGDIDRRVPGTAGTTRDEAYDMMLQLAEARRWSGSEASSSGGGAAAVTTPAAEPQPPPLQQQIRIVGLPPFEVPPAAAALPPLPPSQRELEEQQQLQQQAPELPSPSPSPPLQQQPEAAPVAWQQAAAEPMQPPHADPRLTATATAAAAADAPYGGEPVVPSSYGFASSASSSSFAPSSSSLPYPPSPSYATTPESAGYPQSQQQQQPQGEMSYGWDQQQQQQSQQQQQVAQQQPLEQPSYRAPYNSYNDQPSPVDDGATQTGTRGEAGAYSAAVPPPAPAAVFPPSEQSVAEVPSWYGMQPQQPPPQQQQQQLQPRFPFWPGTLFGGGGAAAAAPPQQQPFPSRSSSGGPPPLPTPSVPSPPPITPSPLQQQQQQPLHAVAAAPPLHSPPTAPAAPPAAPAVDYRPRALDGMSVNEMISEGLRLLRLGREETRKGQDYGLADTLIQSSISAFTRATEQPSPDTAKALGNLGNALLARGELKAAYLETLRAGPPPASYTEAQAQSDAERAMTLEANALLTEAGVMFLKVLEQEGWSSRALVNWGRALVIRADLLAATPDGLAQGGPTLPVVAQLYTSAIDKFEGVLEGEPDMVPAKYRCALAMAGLSRTKPPGSRDRLTLLADSINYLRDVMASPSPDAEALRPAAAAALRQYEAQLQAQRAARGG